ncbi:MAG TPA: DUF2232 domain-containing protein [Gemmatimonadaceae bacterium]|nr:DUF2232 domain-containing protein [Gemmatimonadaceae bacterium]
MTESPLSERSERPPVGAPVERGWGKLLLALGAFLVLLRTPIFDLFAPVEHTLLLFVPALAVCMLVGWWAGGPLLPAIAWSALAVMMAANRALATDAFGTLSRGWSLLLAGAFGLVCLFSTQRPLLTRALVALTLVLGVTLVMGVVGPVSAEQAVTIVSAELARRAADSIASLRASIAQMPDLATRLPELARMPDELEGLLAGATRAGTRLFPALLALESLCALALAWATYHRFARTRLGPPLAPLMYFRFNDQLVWGLIVGLTVLLVPTLAGARPLGQNFVLFFGALFVLRGLGVLAWFLAPRRLWPLVVTALVLLYIPVVQYVAVLGLTMLLVVAFGLGLGDTWADWRNRARPTT